MPLPTEEKEEAHDTRLGPDKYWMKRHLLGVGARLPHGTTLGAGVGAPSLGSPSRRGHDTRTIQLPHLNAGMRRVALLTVSSPWRRPTALSKHALDSQAVNAHTVKSLACGFKENPWEHCKSLIQSDAAQAALVHKRARVRPEDFAKPTTISGIQH